MSKAIYDHVHDLAKTLSTDDRLRLIADLAIGLTEQGKDTPAAPRLPHKTLRGVLKHLGPAPSWEDFQEARREMSGRPAPEEVPR